MQRELQQVTVPAVPATVDIVLNPTQATNVYAPPYASDLYHKNQTKCHITSVKQWMQIKNQANKRCDVTVYVLKPRRDILTTWVGSGGLQGLDPVWLQRMFGAAHQPPILDNAHGAYLVPDRLQPWDEHNADIFMSDAPKFFKIKKIQRKFLEPGAFFKMKFRRKKPIWLNTTTDGVDAGSTYQAFYNHMRKFGPLLLIRSQGSQVQDASTATMPNASNVTITMSMSGFNVQIFRELDWHFRGLGENMAKFKHAIVTDPLAQFAVANEQNFELQVPNNVAMDIG